MNPEDIFHAALAKPQAERAAFLEAACAGDHALRARIAALVQAHENPGSFLAAPPAAPPSPPWDSGSGVRGGPTIEQASVESPGTIIGPYKLLEQIGEGGMGTVWMAQQTEPVKRVVALKLIKAGMDSKQVIARFEAERQALALMDHPNIAKVFDGGAVGQDSAPDRYVSGQERSPDLRMGRPFFVMELVKGVPITKYCDEHHLTPRQRLELFVPVCHAIQHAHQKGIIHRDLKPSNVLVALYDDKPVPKVIDFGVAKATGHALTEATLHTGFGAVVGTVEYMSPEQASFNQLDIDTRSDIYSLGVLLYELLTGSPPFTRKELETAGVMEMLRVIREQEPSKPSTKLSTAEGLPTLAANRGTEPAKLTKLVRGELDWIVMKALEKDRNRRYETANGFAMDVQRYLADEAVLACPPSAGYRLRKFVRRHKGTVFAAVAFLLVLSAGIVGTTLGMVRAERAWEEEAQQRKLVEEERDAKEAARRQAVANLKTARLAVDRMLTRVSEEELLHQPQLEQVRKRLLEDALEFYRGFLKEHGEDPEIQQEAALAYGRFGQICFWLAKWPEAEKNLRQSIAMLGSLPEEFRRTPETQVGIIQAYSTLGLVLGYLHGPEQRREQSTRAFRAALDHAEPLAKQFPESRKYRAMVVDFSLRIVGEDVSAPDAKSLCQRALSLAQRNGDDSMAMGSALHHWSNLVREHDSADALASSRRAVAIFEKLVQELPQSHGRQSGLGWSLNQLAIVLHGMGKTAEADDAIRRSAAAFAKAADDYPSLHVFRLHQTEMMLSRANWLRSANKHAEAEEVYRQALVLLRNLANAGTVPANRLNPLMESFQSSLSAQLVTAGNEDSLALWDEFCRLPQGSGADASRRILAEGTRAAIRIKMANQWAKDGRTADADRIVAELMSDQNQLEPEFARNAQIRADLGLMQFRVGSQLRAAGRLEEARILYERAIGHYEPLTQAAEAKVDHWVRLAECHTHLGIVRQKLGANPQAEAAFNSSIKAWQHIVLEHPTNAAHAASLANENFRLAGFLGGLGRGAEAVDAYAQAITSWDRGVELDPPQLGWAWAAQASRMNRASLLIPLGRHGEALAEFRATLKAYEHFPDDWKKRSSYQQNKAATCDNLARLLVALPDDKARHAAEAVKVAGMAAELFPRTGGYWSTLGLARYRAGEFDAARTALDKALELSQGRNGIDWLVLAMAHEGLGDQEEARKCYDRGVQWMEKNQPTNPELARLRDEAAKTLGIK